MDIIFHVAMTMMMAMAMAMAMTANANVNANPIDQAKLVRKPRKSVDPRV